MSTISSPPSALSAAHRQPFISFARGLSMLSVVLYHLLELVPLPPLLAKANHVNGGCIYVFLFASSYGLYFSRITTWADFYRKRFQKVLLPYYVAVTLIFVLNHFILLYPGDGWPAFLSHLLLYKMFREPYVQSLGPHFWFISTIVQFYLFWPLLRWLGQRWSAPTLLLGALAVSLLHSVFVYQAGLAQERIWYSSAVQYSWVLTLGLVMAREGWLPRLLAWGSKLFVGLLGLGLGGALLLDKLAGLQANIFNDYFMFLAYVSVCALLYFLSQRVPIIGRFVGWVEPISYPLYLIHYVLLMLYLKLLGQTQFRLLPDGPVVLAICLGGALLFDKFLNRVLDPGFWRFRPALRP